MCGRYNASLPPFASSDAGVIQMENYDGAVSSVPSANILCGLECDTRDLPMGHQYIRTWALPDGPSGDTGYQDQKMYDHSQFQIATGGVPIQINAAGTETTVKIGELWVLYNVRLYQPLIPAPAE